MTPKISIITINLNNCDGLQKTIDSVVAQTFKDFEWIVIDGCSTDGSKELIERYAVHITYWVSEPDKGIYNAMNKGIRIAKGEYLLFLNSGDWLCDAEILARFASRNNVEDFVYGNVIKVFSNGALENTKNDSLYCNNGKKLTLKSFVFGTIPHQACFIRRDLFERFGMYDESYKIVSDNVFFIKSILEEGASYKYYDLDVAYFDTKGVGNSCGEEHLRSLIDMYPRYVIDDYLSYNNEIMELKGLLKNKNDGFIIRLFREIMRIWKS